MTFGNTITPISDGHRMQLLYFASLCPQARAAESHAEMRLAKQVPDEQGS
jgi:hypothetical protein